ncbi:MAG: hypothetical protein ABR985_15390 [Methanotrichaceae archaeon]
MLITSIFTFLKHLGHVAQKIDQDSGLSPSPIYLAAIACGSPLMLPVHLGVQGLASSYWYRDLFGLHSRHAMPSPGNHLKPLVVSFALQRIQGLIGPPLHLLYPVLAGIWYTEELDTGI